MLSVEISEILFKNLEEEKKIVNQRKEDFGHGIIKFQKS